MACRTESSTFGDLNVVVTQWPATTALLMKMRFGKIAGPALAALMATDTDGDMEAMIAAAVTTLFESTNSTPEAMTKFIKDCFMSGGVHVNGKQVDAASFETLFSGDGMANLYRILVFIIKVNYADLIPDRLPKASDQTVTQ